jgi:hypothetical protein
MRKALIVAAAFALGFAVAAVVRQSPRARVSGDVLPLGARVEVTRPTGEYMTHGGYRQAVTRTEAFEVVRVHGDGPTRFGRKGEDFDPWTVTVNGVRYVLAPSE